MKRDRQFRPASHFILGVFVVGMGIAFFLQNLGLFRVRDFFAFWPAVLIFIGVSQLMGTRSPASQWGGLMWILFGSLLLAGNLGYIHFQLHDFWPLIFVVIGGRMIIASFTGQRAIGCGTASASNGGNPWNSTGNTQTDASPIVTGMAILGGVDRRVTARDFQRAEITAVMGGGKLDLRDAGMAGKEAVVHVVAVMGGFELLVPREWDLVNEVAPILGGIDDRRHVQPTTPDSPRLILRGVVLMGGVEIRD